jgi:tRNA(Ile)-lysidine synthase
LLEWERQLLTQSETQNLVLTHSSFEGSVRRYRDRIQYVAAVSLDATSLAVGVRWSGEPSLKFAAGYVDFSQLNEHDRDVSTETSSPRLRPIALGENWVIRARREKDKIRLSPNSGGVSVKNMFQQANIPPWLRAEWPILTCNGRVAAIPGVAVDYEFAASDANAGYTLSFHFLPREIQGR